jgi:AcrR family transcriptional regulator
MKVRSRSVEGGTPQEEELALPYITDARRAARRAEMIAAARRCFARDGFHQASMPDIAAEAGLSAGAFYRYFPSKDDLVFEVAQQAFATVFGPVDDLLAAGTTVTIADLMEAITRPAAGPPPIDAAGAPVPIDEMLRCVVQTWAELLRSPALYERARAAFEHRRTRLGEALRRGIQAGTVPPGLDPADGAGVLIAVLLGFLLERVAFGLDDAQGTDGFVAAVRSLMP